MENNETLHQSVAIDQLKVYGNIDAISRNKIVSEVDKNFFVEAGAGSGKTTMLVNRLVAMVESGIPVEKIAAITFTKAAANEFYERFYELLAKRSNPNETITLKGFAGELPLPTDATRILCAQALEKIDLCFMGTIDSFCAMIMSEHPSEAGIPSNSTHVLNEDAKELYRQIYVKICEGEYGKDIQDIAKIFNSLASYQPEEDYVKMIGFFMDHIDVKYEYTPMNIPTDFEATYLTQKTKLLAFLRTTLAVANRKPPVLCVDDNGNEYVTNQDGSTPYINDIYDATAASAAANLLWAHLQEYIDIIDTNWNDNYNEVSEALKKLADFRVTLAADSMSISYFNELMTETKYKGNSRYVFNDVIKTMILSMTETYRYVVAMKFMQDSAKIIAPNLKNDGQLTYFDYLYYLCLMLREDSTKGGKLISYINEKHSYFLIDEFQDTRPLQSELFFRLAASQPKANWKECIPKPGSLFVVGDPKQSIYKFTGADVNAYLSVRELFVDPMGEVLELLSNFRSTNTLKHYFNGTFGQLMSGDTKKNPSGIVFKPIPFDINKLDEPTDEFSGVYKFTSYEEGIEGYENENDAKKILELINKITYKNELKIRNPEDAKRGRKIDDKPRPIEYGDIMVITYEKKHLIPIMKALDAYGIPTKVEGKVLFSDNQAVKELIILYKAIANPGNSKEVYAALTGKIMNFLEEEIVAYKLAGGYLSLTSKVPEEVTGNVAVKMKELRELYLKSVPMSPASVFSELYEKYRIYEIVDSDNMEILYYTIEKIREAERSGEIVSHKDCVAYLEKLINPDSKEERCLSLKGDEGCIHLANVHKVKGLERPIVILSGAKSRSVNVDCKIEQQNDGPHGYFINPGKGFSTKMFDGKNGKKDEEKQLVESERLRLKYVAATRARNALFIADYYSEYRSAVGNSNNVWKELLTSTVKSVEEANEIKNLEENSQKTVNKVYATEYYDSTESVCVAEGDTAEAVKEEQYTLCTPSGLKVYSKHKKEDELSNGVDIEESSETDVTAETTDVNVAEDDAVKKDKKKAAFIGTMVHKFMELYVQSGKCEDVDGIVKYVLNLYPDDDPATAILLNKMADVMSKTGYPQATDVPKDIVTVLTEADECYCEVPFTYNTQGDNGFELWDGVIDVLYRIGDDWHIIDYKTNSEGDLLDEKYVNQLNAYKEAIKETTGIIVRDAKIYHIPV